MTARIPVAPASVAYSLQSRDHAHLRAIAELIRPGAVFAEDAHRFAAALDAVGAVPAIVSAGERPGAERFDELATTVPGQGVTAAFEAVDPNAVAKILFTSGWTGAPKGVLNTHRMLSANQQMMRQVWPFLTGERPVIVDWLPWSHTFGGNHNMNMMLTCGGTIYVDAGRPAPGMFAQTIANLADVPPTIYFNVPAGYAQLVPALESDPAFAARFFSRLRLIFNAAAELPAALRSRLEELAARSACRAVPVTGSWGATETAPAVTTAHFAYADARCIGVPLPGTQVKFAPAEGAYEVRPGSTGVAVPGYDLKIVDEDGLEVPVGTPGTLLVRGESAATGYWSRYHASRQVFQGEWLRTGDTYVLDADGYYTCLGRTGDMLKASGMWVAPGEVEARLHGHQAVPDAVVVAARDADGLEKPVAYVILRPGQITTETELIEFCREGLPAFKRPRRIVFVSEYPTTGTGKIRRVELRQIANDVGLLAKPPG